MTLSMADSTVPGDIPVGYDAYLGYADGLYPTAARLPALFPGAKVVSLTVTGRTLDADGVDVEPGNVNALKGAAWAQAKLGADPGSRPVVYADLATPGYSMADCIAALLALGITRADYRVLTAHYTGQAHVCGPQACGTAFAADGTQWTDKFPGLGGAAIDMSLLAPDFFSPSAGWVLGPVRGLSSVRGPHSLRLSWSGPAGPAPAPVHHYQVTVRSAGKDIRGFPVTLPFAPAVSHQWDDMDDPYDEAMVRACAADGHCSPWGYVRW